jgi:putative peptidoglycan lipid II flippase
VYEVQPGWRKFIRQIVVASLAMILVLAALLWLWQDWTPWSWWQRGWRLAVLVGSGGAVYGALLWLQGIRPRDLRGH